jgi:hypothetical protein
MIDIPIITKKLLYSGLPPKIANIVQAKTATNESG